MAMMKISQGIQDIALVSHWPMLPPPAAAVPPVCPSMPLACLPASPMLRLPAPQDWRRRGGGGSSGGLPAVPMRSSSAMTLNA